MTKQEKHIYQKFLAVAFVIHNYRIGDKQYFYSLFPKVAQDILDKAWATETKKAPIIDFYEKISDEEELIINDKFTKLRFNDTKIFDYLLKPISKSVDIKAESALRKLMANSYIRSADFAINDLTGIPDSFLSEDFNKKRKKKQIKILFGLIIIITVTFSSPRIIEGFTPVETLARKYHEESRYTYSGSLCWDGWKSQSRGRGTCSHHGGIKSYFEKGDYSLTFQQCLERARQRSWRE